VIPQFSEKKLNFFFSKAQGNCALKYIKKRKKRSKIDQVTNNKLLTEARTSYK
jgi:hypothetical protein